MEAGWGHHPPNCLPMPSDGDLGALTLRSTYGLPSVTHPRLLKRCSMTNKLPERLRLDRLATPIGEALIVTDEAGYLRAFDWTDCEFRMARQLRLHYGSIVPQSG